jgi:Gram-negative bacterial TonB protein C-terminal
MRAMVYGLGIALVLLVLGLFDRSVRAQKSEKQRDEQPSVVDFEDMKYPLAARLKHTEGVVVLRVRLNKDGEVLGAEALSGPRDLVPDCLANAKTWRFLPNSGESAIIVYWFRIEGLCHGFVSSQFAVFASNFARITSCEAHVEP